MPKRSSYDRLAVDALFAAQDGLARRRQLLDLEVPENTIDFRLRPKGPWQRLLPGVVLAQSGPATHAQRMRGALLFAGDGAVLTGGSALRLHGVRGARKTQQAHALVPHSRRRGSFGYVTIERTRLLPPPEDIGGLQVAPVARACVDGVRRLDDLGVIREITAEVVQRRMTTVAGLASALRAAARQRTALPNKALNEVRAGVRSAAEAAAYEIIEKAPNIPPPRWNVRLETVAGAWLGDPDAYWDDVVAALQLDSMEWHLGPADYKRTQASQRRLTNAGVMVLPYAPGDLINDPARFLRELESFRAEARRRTPPDDVAVRLRDAAA